MGSLRDVTLGELVQALARYRPVAITVGVILVALAVIPEPDRPDTQATGFEPNRTADAANAVASSEPVPPTEPGIVPVSPTPDFSPAPPVESSFPEAEATGGSPDPGHFGATDEPTNTTPDDDQPIDPRLRIVGKAWASRTGGTPLAAEGVPEDSLPVGTRIGQDDKLSFVRLQGTDEVFRVSENPAGTRNVSGPSAVRACQVTEANWAEAEATPIQDAPDYDASACVEGVRNEDGVWSFDLVSLPSPTDARGVALVPGEGAGLDFQVAFQAA